MFEEIDCTMVNVSGIAPRFTTNGWNRFETGAAFTSRQTIEA
ncbi:MAG: hypothetical protein ABIT64_05035 [Lysobacteraceae bacterium]